MRLRTEERGLRGSQPLGCPGACGVGSGGSAPRSLAATPRGPAGGPSPCTEEETQALRGKVTLTEKPLDRREPASLTPHLSPSLGASSLSAGRLGLGGWDGGAQLCPQCPHLWPCERPLKEEGAQAQGGMCHPGTILSTRRQKRTPAEVTLTLEPALFPVPTPAVEDVEGLDPGGHVAQRGGCRWGAASASVSHAGTGAPRVPTPSVLWVTACPPLLTPEPAPTQS